MMGKKGFTLIELLIVIAILGILVALILPRFADVRTDANTKVCVANLRGLSSAMATYVTKENMDVDWEIGNGGSAFEPGDLVDWKYIAAEPFCPYEQNEAVPSPYVLKNENEVTGTPDKADCPNVATYTEHVWP